jgi:IS5 family transposase
LKYFKKITFRGWNMRKKREPQLNLLRIMAKNKVARELESISLVLDENKDILDLVYRDLVKHRRQDTGRRGMTAEQVLRCAILKQYRELTYEELAFHLDDSQAFRSFARLDMGQYPSDSTLQANITAIDASWRRGAPCGWMPPWWKPISIIPPIPPCWWTASG